MQRVIATALLAGAWGTGCTASPTTTRDAEPWSVDDIADLQIVRNTLSPRSAIVSVHVPGAPDALIVDLTPDDPAILSAQLLRCSANPCELTLTPSPAATASTAVTVAVEADGRVGETSFQLDVVPIWVTDVSSDGPGTLRAVVAEVEAGDVVAFDTRGAFAEPRSLTLDPPVDLTQDITIEGPGIDQLTLAGPAGALRVLAPAHAAVSGLAVSGSTITDEDRGAITVEPSAHLVLRSTRFAGNQALLGAGVHVTEATLEVADTEFVDNTAEVQGGAVWASNSIVQVSQGTFERNDAFDGGALCVVDGGQLLITDSRFEENTARRDGGAVLTQDGGSVSIQASSFVGNRTSSSGGALSLEGAVTAEIAGSSFTSNVSGSIGGALRADDDGASLSLSESSLDHNEAPFGIVWIRNGTLRDVQIVDNAVDVGNVWLEGGVVDITNAVVSGNTAQSYGPGLFLTRAQVTVTGGSIVDNVGSEGSSSFGGGVFASGSSAAFDQVEIARNIGGLGAGLYVSYDASVILRESMVYENGGLQVQGAGAYVDEGGTLILEGGTQVRANTTLETGGGVLVRAGAELVVHDATIGGDLPADGNQSANGGGIFNIGTVTLSSDSVIRHNRANVGGALFQGQSVVDATHASLSGATITDNVADSLGGGIYLVGDANISASSQVTISSNAAGAPNGGGGMYRAGPFSKSFACDFPVSSVVSNLDGDAEIDNVQPSPGGCF